MKRWALVVVLYALILALLAVPVAVGAFAQGLTDVLDFCRRMLSPGKGGRLEFFTAYFTFWPLWVWVGVWALAQAALLVVPVRLARGRPVTRRWILWPVLAAVFCLLAMVGGMYLALREHLDHTKGLSEETEGMVFAALAVVWILWAFLFGFYTGGREPKRFMSRLTRFLISGSILELLVAVPTHVVARSRNYCCAGFQTFIGLAVGLSVMLFAFGPAVFMLFVRRWQSLRRG